MNPRINFEISVLAEDTLTLYTDKEFNGAAITIIEDMVNTTFSAGPLSAMVTGKLRNLKFGRGVAVGLALENRVAFS